MNCQLCDEDDSGRLTRCQYCGLTICFECEPYHEEECEDNPDNFDEEED